MPNNQNQLVTDPSLQDVLNLFKKDIFLSLNCHALATVQTFDADNQTVVCKMNYSKTYYERSSDGIYNPIVVPYPVLMDLPVVIMGGGLVSLTFPIEEGDQCLVLFNDRDIDNWFAGATSGPVASERLHSFSDGIALIGLNDVQGTYDSDRALLSDGNVKLGINPNTEKVVCQNDDKSLLGVLQLILFHLQELCDQVSGLHVLPGSFAAGGDPVTGFSGVPTNASQIDQIKDFLGDDSDALAEFLETI